MNYYLFCILGGFIQRAGLGFSRKGGGLVVLLIYTLLIIF